MLSRQEIGLRCKQILISRNSQCLSNNLRQIPKLLYFFKKNFYLVSMHFFINKPLSLVKRAGLNVDITVNGPKNYDVFWTNLHVYRCLIYSLVLLKSINVTFEDLILNGLDYWLVGRSFFSFFYDEKGSSTFFYRDRGKG